MFVQILFLKVLRIAEQFRRVWGGSPARCTKNHLWVVCESRSGNFLNIP